METAPAVFYNRSKRLFDIALAALMLLLVSPIMTVVAIAIRVSSAGPVLYRGIRVGLNSRLFAILKFRTMVVSAESLGGSATAADDPRITRVGKFLISQKYVNLYSSEEKAILSLRPGITDWASIWNSNEADVLEGSRDPEKTYEELIRPTKIALQLLYVRNHSLLIDLKILIHTALKLIHEDWFPKELKPYGRVKRYRMISAASA